MGGPSWADPGPTSLDAPGGLPSPAVSRPCRQPCHGNSARNGVVSIFKFRESKFSQKAPKKGPRGGLFSGSSLVDPGSSRPACTPAPAASRALKYFRKNKKIAAAENEFREAQRIGIRKSLRRMGIVCSFIDSVDHAIPRIVAMLEEQKHVRH